MKAAKALYYFGLILSMLVGVWHFFVPWMFQWYSYIPNQYENLIVGIDWTNFFFSLLLTGVSLLLITLGKKIFNGNKDLLVFYGFLSFVWLCRAAITFIEPWPLEPIAWAAYGQQIAAIMIFIIQFIPFVFLVKRLRTQRFDARKRNTPRCSCKYTKSMLTLLCVYFTEKYLMWISAKK